MVEETKYDYAIKYLDELNALLSTRLQRMSNGGYAYMHEVVTRADIIYSIELIRAKILGDMIQDKTNMLKENQDNGN